MKNYEDPNMELFDINNGMKSGFDVNSNDDETEYGGGFGPLIG